MHPKCIVQVSVSLQITVLNTYLINLELILLAIYKFLLPCADNLPPNGKTKK